MASISTNKKNGTKRILFRGADGERKSVRLGKVTMRSAESVKTKIEDLVTAATTGHTPADKTSRWIAGLEFELHSKLAKTGLVKPRGVGALGDFTQSYIDGRVDIEASTRVNLESARRHLITFFKPDTAMRNIGPADAEDFRLYMVSEKLADNTARRIIGRSRQFFTAAIKRGLIQTNPFDGIPASVRANQDRFYFVTREETQKVLDACPDDEWRLIIALARYGGLRCPSEILALKLADVNWEHDRVCVPSPKTKRYEGKASRMIPLFPELRPWLLKVFDQAEPGTEYAITRYRGGKTNLRTQMLKIIRRAGIEPWGKPFQNMRSTRETELAETFPMHVVCKWIGNSQPVAAAHYLQLTDEHFTRALKDQSDSKAAQNASQNAAHHTTSGDLTEPLGSSTPAPNEATNGGIPGAFQHSAETHEVLETPRAGLEPAT